MKRKISLFSALLTLLPLCGMAQEDYQILEGKLLQMPYFTSADIFNMSNQSYSYGTARTAAMGGAFASLGADVSSMNINPAGLGMYRGSEFSLTPSLNTSRSTVGYPGGFTGDNTATRFAVGNMAAALNLLESSGPLTSVTLGFGYNRMADYNYSSGLSVDDQNISIADIFAEQLNYMYPDPSSIGPSTGSRPFNDNDILDWGSILAYRAGVIGNDGTDYYIPSSVLPGGIPVTHSLLSTGKGHLGEFAVSAGMNFSNVFYLGFTMGIQELYYKQNEQYTEFYDNSPGSLSMMGYDQSVKYSGSGVNFKVGAIFRPIAPLRIGLAVHTPAFMSVNRQYCSSLEAHYKDARAQGYRSNIFESDMEFITPTRLMTGLSYAFGDIAVLAVDYECVWFNGMRLYDNEGYEDFWGDWHEDTRINPEFKEDAKANYRQSHNIRAGLEIKPLPELAIRAGYANQGRAVKNADTFFRMPVAYKSENVSVGLGYRFGNVSLDFAYVNSKSTLTPCEIYYFEDNIGSITHDHPVDTKRTYDNFMLTAGFRF